MRRRLGALAAVVLVAAFVVGPVVLASPAGAIMTGPCGATVNGIDVVPLPVDDPAAAIKVPEGGTVSWSVSSPSVVRSRNLVMSFAGVNVTIDRGTSTGSDGGSRSDTVNIDDYAWMGAGLYQVAGVGRLGDGTTCTGAVLIEVGGNPLATVGGAVGLILVVLGSAGVIVGAIRQGGGRLVRDLIDLIELQGPDGIRELLGGDNSTGSGPGGGATSTGDPTGGGATSTGDPTGGGATSTGDPSGGGGATSTGDPTGGATSTDPTAATTTTPPADAATTAPTGDAASTTADPAASEAAKPPPLPGMEAVAAIGTTATALSEATEQLDGHIDDLPISDEQKEKLKETLATGTIKEKLDVVNEVVETVQHFEEMGTDTVDKMNRWGVNANGINGLLWLRTMAEASGRLGQKAVDGIVTPIIEPITKVAGEAGIEADAEEITHTLLPVQEVAEEASKALLQGAKNVLGGDNILDQLGQNAENDEEWRNIRTFN